MKHVGRILLWLVIAFLNALLTWAAIILFTNDAIELGAIQLLIIVLIDFAVFNPKGYPYRYTIPALSLLLILTVYPIFYTFKIAFTNYGTGHLFTRKQAIERLMDTYITDKDAAPFSYKVYVEMKDFKPTQNFVLVFEREGSKYLAETPAIMDTDQDGNTTRSVSQYRPVKTDNVLIGERQFDLIRSLHDGDEIMAVREEAGGDEITYSYFFSFEDPSTLANQRVFISQMYVKYLDSVEFTAPDGPTLRFGSRYGFRKLVESERKYTINKVPYEEDGVIKERTELIDRVTGQPLQEEKGSFYEIDENGIKKTVAGYRDYIGTENFEKMFTDQRFTGPFIKIFIWTFIWAALSVLFSFAIGLGFALLLNDQHMKGKNLYRTLLIIPWAIPAFISVLVWRNGFFNETYGIINKIILGQWLGLDAVRWLGDAFFAKVSVLIVNIWLGFPYMMLVCLGALQSIPGALYEAASIDGASKFKKFHSITLPLLMTSVTPLLIGAFAFNFNNFTNIYLLTRGGPAMADSLTNAGSTDILISYTYKLAFQGERGQDFGYASAIALFIFIIVAGISYLQFKFAGTFEEVNR